MAESLNALRWDGDPGHYEVYYLSATDRGSGCGLWIRYTMVAPVEDEATCSLWLMAMDGEQGQLVGRKRSWPASELVATAEPFKVRIAGAELDDRGMRGGFDDVAWDLRWNSRLGPAEHVHPLLRAARLAKTVLVLPHPHLEIEGRVKLPWRELSLNGAHGGQAHLWGSKHAERWAWAHCDDFEGADGEPRPDAFIDGVSVYVRRMGREIGPNTPVVGRFAGRDFASVGPVRVTRNPSRFDLTSWEFEARDGGRRVAVEVQAPRDRMVGVTYHDPDGQKAYCYNSEIASMKVRVWEGQRLVDELAAPGRAHFEYAQREPLADLELQVA